MQKARKASITALSQYIDEKLAVAYEKKIFDMCAKLNGFDPLVESYREIAYEKIGQISEAKDKAERVRIIEDIIGNRAGWESSVYEEIRENYKAKLDKSVQKPKAIKGLYKCKKRLLDDTICPSDEFIVWQAQTRSADEGMTTFRQCVSCGARGKEN